MEQVSMTYTWTQTSRPFGDCSPPGLVVYVTMARSEVAGAPWQGLLVRWTAAGSAAEAIDEAAGERLAAAIAASGLPAHPPELTYRCHSGFFGVEEQLSGVIDGQPFVFHAGGWAVIEEFTAGPGAPAWKALVAALKGR